MQQTSLARALAAFPASSPNLKAHGFVNQHNAGMRGMFKTVREGNTIIATRERDGFRLEIDLEAALNSNEGSRTACAAMGMPYPYAGINNTSKFFLPAGAITCKVRTGDGAEGLKDIVCEGYMCLESKEIKIDCIDMENHAYFWYVIGPNCMAFC